MHLPSCRVKREDSLVLGSVVGNLDLRLSADDTTGETVYVHDLALTLRIANAFALAQGQATIVGNNSGVDGRPIRTHPRSLMLVEVPRVFYSWTRR